MPNLMQLQKPFTQNYLGSLLNRCTDGSLQVLHFRSREINPDSYREPVIYILKNKLSGIETPPGTDMDGLLKGFGL
jgi:hypothetical protein